MTRKTKIRTKLRPQGEEVIFYLSRDRTVSLGDMSISKFIDIQAEIFEYLDNGQNSHFEIEQYFMARAAGSGQIIAGVFYMMAPKTALYFRTRYGGEKVDNSYIVVK